MSFEYIVSNYREISILCLAFAVLLYVFLKYSPNPLKWAIKCLEILLREIKFGEEKTTLERINGLSVILFFALLVILILGKLTQDLFLTIIYGTEYSSSYNLIVGLIISLMLLTFSSPLLIHLLERDTSLIQRANEFIGEDN